MCGGVSVQKPVTENLLAVSVSPSLQSSVDSFFTKERSDVDIWCDTCGQRTSQDKALCWAAGGNFLIIQAKRFTEEGTKIKTPMNAEETITISSHQYHLRGIVFHRDGNHYVASFKESGNDGVEIWSVFDDAIVSCLKEAINTVCNSCVHTLDSFDSD